MFKRLLAIASIMLFFFSVFSIYAVFAEGEIEILGPGIVANVPQRPRCGNNKTSCGEPGFCVDLTGMVWCERGRVVEARCLSNNIRNETLTSSCDGGSYNFRFGKPNGEESNATVTVYEQDTSNVIGRVDVSGDGTVNSLDAMGDMDVNFMNGEFVFLIKGVDFSTLGATPEIVIDKVDGTIPGTTVFKTLYVELPDGMTFASIILKIDYSDISETGLVLYKCADFDSSTGECNGAWEIIPIITDSVNGMVIAEIDSFSAYSLGGEGGDTSDQECYQDSDCDDGLYCNGVEVCTEGVCESGDVVDCSGNDLSPIESCTDDPDGNPFTLDQGTGVSVCDEDTDSCTSPNYTYTHICNIGTCDAECAADSDCVCPNDKCVGEDYYDYPDKGDCLSDCSCDVNSGDGRPCEPNIIESHSACIQSTSGDTTSSPPPGPGAPAPSSSGDNTDSSEETSDSNQESSSDSSDSTDTTSSEGESEEEGSEEETLESNGNGEESADISGRAIGFNPSFNTYMLIVIPVASMIGAFTYNFFRKNGDGYQGVSYKGSRSRGSRQGAKASRSNRKTKVQRKKKQQTKIVLNL